jgi:hypothetical protein
MKLPAKGKFPKELHVNEETYSIKWVDKRPEWNNKRDCGLCDPQTCTIYLKRGMNKAKAFRTLIHEAIHAMEAEYDIDLPHTVVYQLEKAIADTLLMNF